jgi:iron complex outermembrane recepter protein
MNATRGASFLTLDACKSVARALALGVLIACGVVSLAVNAQQATTAAAQQNAPATVSPPPCPNGGTSAECGNKATAPQLETVVITGTLIARPAAETAEAITVVQSESLKNMGIATVEQAVDQLTSNVPGVNTVQSVTQYTGGGSFANLRDLGQSKTLVLLDGQRLANNVIAGNSVDLNGIPFSAIESVQVLREGASSIYGSDAIGGVINFITKKDYQGGEVDLNAERPQDPGGGSQEGEFSFGHGDLFADGYNFMITGSYSRQQELKASQRSFAATGFDPTLGLTNQNGPTAPWPGSYTDANGNIWQTGYPACAGNPYLTRSYGNCAYRYSAAVDLLPKSDQASALAVFTKQLPANNTIAVQYFYSRADSVAWFGPQSYSFDMTAAADPTYYPTAANSTCYHACSAPPDLSAPITAGWTDPNNNRITENENLEQRVLLTFSGNNAGWDYTTDFDYSVSENTFDVDGGEANYAIIAPDSLLSNLINPFGPQSAAGQALINSAYRDGTLGSGKLQHYDIGGHASHQLGDALHAGTAAVLALGFSAQNERINFATTPLAQTLYTDTYYPPNAVSGSRESQAIFAELDVPMSKSLDVDIADREDRYSDFGETNNGKISFRYQPLRALTFRGAASTGFRAPSLVDLYTPDQFGAAAGGTMPGPPCATGQYTTVFSYTNCTSQGLELAGGNTKLQPETSENFDFGVILEPITNLGITLDYYRILVKNEIQSIPDTAIYGNPTAFANDYVLNSAGTLTPAPEANTQCPTYTAPTCGYIITKIANTGGITTDGFDLSVQYLVRTPVGVFHADLEGTAITHYTLQEFDGAPQLDLVGWFNDGNEPAVRWQHIMTISWTSPGRNWDAGIVNRFFSSYIDEAPDAAGNQRVVGSQSTFDAYTSYKPILPLTVLFGIRNVFNQIPPFSNQINSWGAGYNPVFSSPLLRTFYVNLKYEF